MLYLRTARSADAAAVARVHVRSWQAAYRGLLPDEYLDALRPEDRMGRYTFGSPDPRVPATIVALDYDEICGFVTTGTAQDADVTHAGELLAIYVDPAAWSLGIGRRLMAEAVAHLTGRGFNEAVLWVFAGNDRGQRFYRNQGWALDGCARQKEISATCLDEVRYRCRIS